MNNSHVHYRFIFFARVLTYKVRFPVENSFYASAWKLQATKHPYNKNMPFNVSRLNVKTSFNVNVPRFNPRE